jgi:hypothetical protein
MLRRSTLVVASLALSTVNHPVNGETFHAGRGRFEKRNILKQNKGPVAHDPFTGEDILRKGPVAHDLKKGPVAHDPFTGEDIAQNIASDETAADSDDAAGAQKGHPYAHPHADGSHMKRFDDELKGMLDD